MSEKMLKALDFDPDHLIWLVEKRSENQRSALKLHLLLNERAVEINKDPGLADAAQALVAIVFSLWRAVFLSDLAGNEENILTDARAFLVNLVAHNAVAYPQDRTTKEWTFIYYVNNARYRLKALIDDPNPHILSQTDFDIEDYGEDKERWETAQTAANRAIENFAKFLEGVSLK